ncbi:universal stress protein [Noviherbaspirillum sp. CPCC 100848]|uniref:Universal stress protein n=1 Tax=Noviherbaspirillum album TaxID=3080276 RepID=A0ABU6J3Z6_9BURK|nr:universal stress protein [Noviherbaspirillum sp. CPCC 100848]MEC4718090.1 universal stress protein [Noviherbaspirillum sp. CPCC 100848]
MKIQILVDGSACSAKAVDYVATHLDFFQGKESVQLLHIHPKVPGGLAASIVGNDAIHAYFDAESKAALAPAENILREKGIPHQADYMIGDIAEQVPAYVAKHGIEMIVMGSHGHGVLKGMGMGSMPTRVLATASVPVLIVR